MSQETPEGRSRYRWLTDVTSPWGKPTATIRLRFLFANRLAPFAQRVMDRLKARYVDLRITTLADSPDAPPESSDLVFVLIDEHWTDCLQTEVPDSRYRLQINQALAIGSLPVVPMLIGEAEMPQEQQLGHDLALLADRNAIRIDPGRSFEDHIRILIDGINFHYRDRPIRWANAPIGSGVRARIERIADWIAPITVPPEERRSAPWYYLAACGFMGSITPCATARRGEVSEITGTLLAGVCATPTQRR